MSRSYKRPFITDGSRGSRSGRSMKSFANKKVRHTEDLPTRQRGAYKKCFCSYDICDYKWEYTLDKAIEDWYKEESLPEFYTKTYHTTYLNPDTDEYEEKITTYSGCLRPLHKKFKNLETFLTTIKKDYYRK